jgi:WD40 repeat protein
LPETQTGVELRAKGCDDVILGARGSRVRIFLSFHTKDAVLADRLRAGLNKLDPKADIFFSPASLAQGFWQPKLAESIAGADAFLLLLGPAGVGRWQDVEYQEALGRHVDDRRFALVPVIADGSAAPGLPFLRMLNWIEAPEIDDDKTLHRILGALAGGDIKASTPLWKLVQPYRGLVAMDEANADYFFGRAAETETVLRTLSEKPGRLPILIGASGVGKSSVAQAGVLSALKAMRWPGDGSDKAARPWPAAFQNSRAGWVTITIRPGDDPFAALASAFTRLWLPDATDPKRGPLMREWADGLKKANTLADLLDATQEQIAAREGAAPARVFLHLDQGEELYTRAQAASPRDAARFSEVLAQGLADPRLLVLASLRADYFDRLQADALFCVYEHVNVPPLTEAQLEEVVTGPARALEVGFEDERLPPRIVEAAARAPGALPLLSYLLTDMWSAMVARGDGTLRLPLRAIDIGGVLAATAESFLQSRPGDEAHLRRLLTLRLALVPTEGEPLRRQALRSECSGEEWALAERLADYPWRLVVTGERHGDGEAVVEVAHEALLRTWPRLQDWLKEERDFLVFKGEVERAERRWQELGRPDNARLSGLDLARAEEWLARRAADLAEPVRGFVQQSIAADRGEKERQLRFQRRVSVAAVVVSIAAVIAALAMAGIGTFAWNQWGRATSAENAAQAALLLARENESRALAALATEAAHDGSFTGSIGLALAGWPRGPGDARPRLPAVLDSLALGLSLVPLRREYLHNGTINGALLTADETRILSWSGDKTLRLWDMASGKQLARAMTHDGWVLGAALNAGETRILSWSDDQTVRLWDAASGQQIGPAMQHDSAVNGALMTRDEHRILSWSGDRTLRLWDAASGQQIGPAMRHDNAVEGAALTRDESRILSWSADNTVRLWDAASGKEIAAAMTHDDAVKGALFSPDESRILSWSYDQTVRLWDAASGQPIGPAMRHEGEVNGALMTQDGRRILSWAADGTLRLWDAASGMQIGEMKHAGAVRGALLIHNETRIVSWSADGTVRLWDAASGRSLGPEMKHDDEVFGVRMIADESRILSWSADGTVRLWEAASAQPIAAEMKHAQIRGALASRDGARILTWSEDGTMRLWEAAIGREIDRGMRHDKPVNGALMSADEKRILSWSADGTLRLWDATTNRPIVAPMDHRAPIAGAIMSGDEKRAATWSANGTLRLWELATGHPIGAPMRHAAVRGALFTRDGSRLVSWSSDHTLQQWDAATSAPIGPAMAQDAEVEGALLIGDNGIISWSADGSLRRWELAGSQSGLELASVQQVWPAMRHQARVTGALLTKDERHILSWSEDRTLRVWDAATGREIAPAMMHAGAVNGALISADEQRIVSWSEDGTLRVWDAATHRQIGPDMRHDEAVIGARLTRDGSRIVSLTRDETLRLWDAATGAQIGPAMRHEMAVRRGARVDVKIGELNTDETRLLAWSFDGTLRLWDLATAQQIGPTMKHNGPVLGAHMTGDGTRILSWSRDGTLRLWDAAWQGRNLLEIACNHSLPDHDLTAVSARYGVNIAEPICQPGKAIPPPDWAAAR